MLLENMLLEIQRAISLFHCYFIYRLGLFRNSLYYKPLDIRASKFGDFKRLTYWRSFVLAVSQTKLLYTCTLIEATFKGKNMLRMGSYYFLK